jgi:hypothetical protein
MGWVVKSGLREEQWMSPFSVVSRSPEEVDAMVLLAGDTPEKIARVGLRKENGPRTVE